MASKLQAAAIQQMIKDHRRTALTLIAPALHRLRELKISGDDISDLKVSAVELRKRLDGVFATASHVRYAVASLVQLIDNIEYQEGQENGPAAAE